MHQLPNEPVPEERVDVSKVRPQGAMCIVLVHGCCTDANDVTEWAQLADKMVGQIIQEEFNRYQKKQQPKYQDINYGIL
jgi:hypothetical protein